MANEIQWRHTATGATLYCTFRHLGGTMWNGSTLETMTVANWATYDLALTETPASSYLYLADWPESLAGSAAWYWVDVFLQAGAGPAITDTVLGTQILHCTSGGVCIGPVGADIQAVAGSTGVADALYNSFGVVSPVWTAADVNQTGDVYAKLPTNFEDLSVADTTGKVAATIAAGDGTDAAAVKVVTDKVATLIGTV